MAIITRSYAPISPSNTELVRFVGATASIVAMYSEISVTIQLDDAVDSVGDLDRYMEELGYMPAAANAAPTQVFQYVVTGMEADLNNLVIPLPAARPTADYVVLVSMEEFTAILATGVKTAGKAVNGFVLSLSAPASAGDVFSFEIKDAP